MAPLCFILLLLSVVHEVAPTLLANKSESAIFHVVVAAGYACQTALFSITRALLQLFINAGATFGASCFPLLIALFFGGRVPRLAHSTKVKEERFIYILICYDAFRFRGRPFSPGILLQILIRQERTHRVQAAEANVMDAQPYFHATRSRPLKPLRHNARAFMLTKRVYGS